MTIIRWAISLALLALTPPALAQTANQITAPGGWAPMSAPCVRQVDGTCIPVSADNPLPISGGGGGGGGAGTEYTEDAASAANPVAPALQLRRRDTPSSAEVSAEGDWVTAIADSQGQMRVRAKELEALLGSPFQAGGSIGNTAFGISGTLPAFAAIPTVYAQGAAADGAAVAGSPVSVAGTDGTNNRRLRTDARGGLVPAQGVVASTRTTLTASTATAIEAAGVAARTLESIFTEAALAANVYLCTTQTTSCSATVYDFLIPSGAAAGTIFTPPFATTGRLYAYSTGTPVLVVNSWTAP